MSAAAAAASAASAKGSLAVKLKRKRTTTDHDGPILVRFPHGPPAQLMKPDSAQEDIEFKMYAHTEERKNFQRILLATTPGVVYAAQNFGSTQSFKSNANQYAIGVFDSSKSKVKIIACNHVYKMEQHVRALDGIDATKQAASEDSFATKQRVLADTFGSKKTQKRLASRAANEVTVQESTSQVLTHAIGTIQPNEMEAESSLLEAIHQTVLPAYDETAEQVRDIYAPESIAPTVVLDALGPSVKAWRAVVKKGKSGVEKDAKSDTPLTKSTFIQGRLAALAALDRSDDRDATLKLMIYLDLMLQFRNGGKNKKKVVGEWDAELVSERVKEQLLGDFTTSVSMGGEGSRLVFDGAMEQKLLCHIAVGSILLANFTLDHDQIEHMAADLKMMTSDMLKYYAEAGCTVGKSRIQLTAPLRLPKLRRKIERK